MKNNEKKHQKLENTKKRGAFKSKEMKRRRTDNATLNN